MVLWSRSDLSGAPESLWQVGMGACAKVLTGDVGTFTSLPVASFLDHLKDASFFWNHKTAIEGFLLFHFAVSVLLKLKSPSLRSGKGPAWKTDPNSEPFLSSLPKSQVADPVGCGVRALAGIQTLQLTAV